MPNINETKEQCKERWSNSFRPLLGLKIINIRWLSEKEVKDHDWFRSCIVIHLSDGTMLYPSADDEGNDSGALFLSLSARAKKDKVPDTAPVI